MRCDMYEATQVVAMCACAHVQVTAMRARVQVKLYFMIGLPGELDEDVLGIAETVRWLQAECSDDNWKLAIHITISNFTPKPHTPFQCAAAAADTVVFVHDS